MRNIYWIIILISFQSYSQNEQWYNYELDSIVKFKLPSQNADLFNSEQDNVKMYELSVEKDNIVYSGNKIQIEKNILPNNLDDLYTLYDDSMSDISNNYPDTKEINKNIKRNGFIGRKLILIDSNGIKQFESQIFLLENHLYLFMCLSKKSGGIKKSDYFFNQISLPMNSEIEQLTGKSLFIKLLSKFKIEFLILIVIIGFIISLIVIKKIN